MYIEIKRESDLRELMLWPFGSKQFLADVPETENLEIR